VIEHKGYCAINELWYCSCGAGKEWNASMICSYCREYYVPEKYGDGHDCTARRALESGLLKKTVNHSFHYAFDADEKGKKDDADKIQLELIPTSLIMAVGTVFTFGAKKYGVRNWEKGFAWSRAFGALMRHLWAWWQGENLDPETGKSHLWHAVSELAFLIEFETTQPTYDDRPKKQVN